MIRFDHLFLILLKTQNLQFFSVFRSSKFNPMGLEQKAPEQKR